MGTLNVVAIFDARLKNCENAWRTSSSAADGRPPCEVEGAQLPHVGMHHPMNRPISTQAHGAIDYTWAAAAGAITGKIAGAPRTRSLLRRASAAATGSALFTKYEAGLVPVLPMKGHLALDFVMCGALLLSPLFLPPSERRYAAIPVAFGIAGLVAGLLTQTRSPLEQQWPRLATETE
jgi:hypothetical protein